MERYSFFNAVVDEAGQFDREYLAEDFARYFAAFVGNGVYANPASNLQIMANSDLSVMVNAGRAWINGYFYELTDFMNLPLTIPQGTGERIDRVVVRLDLINRNIKTAVKTGAEAISATPPALQRDEKVYEICLADVKIRKNSIKISQADIKDTRFDKQLCGMVSGVVDQIDTSSLFKQYDDAFVNWFATVQDELSTNQAGNLQNQINKINSALPTFAQKVDISKEVAAALTTKPIDLPTNPASFKILSNASFSTGNVNNINLYIEAQNNVMNNGSELFIGTLGKKPKADTLFSAVEDETKSHIAAKVQTNGALSIRGNNQPGKRHLFINMTYCS